MIRHGFQGRENAGNKKGWVQGVNFLFFERECKKSIAKHWIAWQIYATLIDLTNGHISWLSLPTAGQYF